MLKYKVLDALSSSVLRHEVVEKLDYMRRVMLLQQLKELSLARVLVAHLRNAFDGHLLLEHRVHGLQYHAENSLSDNFGVLETHR